MDESVLPATLRHDSLHLETRLARRQQTLAGHRKGTRPLRSTPALGKTLHDVSPATPLHLQQAAPVHRPNQKVRPPRQIPQRLSEHQHLHHLNLAGPHEQSLRSETPCQLPPSCIDSSGTGAHLSRTRDSENEMSDVKAIPGGDRFPPTRWSVIDAARSSDQAERARAMDTLCAAYWKPVYKYVRLRWNHPAEDAQDLTQGFFLQVMERALLEKFDPAKSRLRTYLRVCVDSFVMNEEKAAKRQKRGGSIPHVALDFAGAEQELGGTAVIDPAAIPSPGSLEEFFENEWLRSLFGVAVDELRKRCAEEQRETTFRLFEEYDLAGDDSVSYQRLAQDFGIPVTDVTNALSWARREFRRISLGRLREICGSEAEFRREARAVFGWDSR